MSDRVSRRASILCIAGALALAAGCGATGSEPAGTAAAAKPSAAPAAKKGRPTMIAAYPATGAQYAPLFVGIAEGFYARNGVDVTARVVHGSTVEASALLSGSIQVAMSEENVALTAMAKGAPLVIVGSDFYNWPFELWAKPSIASVADLRGKPVGLAHVGSAVEVSAEQLLAKYGLQPNQVRYDFLGGTSERVAALIAGKVDAIIISPPNGLKAQAKGFRLLYDLSKLPHITGAIEMTRAFIRRHPNEVTDFLKGHIEAVDFIKNPANKAKVLSILAKYTRVSHRTVVNARLLGQACCCCGRCPPGVLPVPWANRSPLGR